jgi:hypothetical protein
METCQVSAAILDATSKIGSSRKNSSRAGELMSAISLQPVKSVSVKKKLRKTCD